MAKRNPHFDKLKKTYIFSTIEEKLNQVCKEKPNANILNLGIGDVALPLAPTIGQAIKEAVDEMVHTVHGYGYPEGYAPLQQAILEAEYEPYGFGADEIFISDGANTNASSVQELFDKSSQVLVADPTYPVYVDANIIAGKEVILLPTRAQDGFIPRPPPQGADLVYLCTPCNPTGVALNRKDLQQWIDWAKKHKAIIIIDNVYDAFISSEKIPPSIYELPGGKEVAIEIRSFSKTAGFTGLRCAYMVVPKALHIPNLHSMWVRRTNAKSNGVSFPIQKGALACFTPEGKQEIRAQIEEYKQSAKILRTALKETNQTFYGGVHSPYIFWQTMHEETSWDFFDTLLNKAHIIAIPGSGFGMCGEGFIRLSCFLPNEKAIEAGNRIKKLCATL